MSDSETTRTPLVYDELLARCMGEIEFAQRILNDFLKTSAPLLDEIRDSVSQTSFREASRRVHRLKGTAATVAAKPLMESLRELEQVLHADPEPATGELTDKLAASCRKFEEVQAYIQNRLLNQ